MGTSLGIYPRYKRKAQQKIPGKQELNRARGQSESRERGGGEIKKRS